jgi:hypothetical protein
VSRNPNVFELNSIFCVAFLMDRSLVKYMGSLLEESCSKICIEVLNKCFDAKSDLYHEHKWYEFGNRLSTLGNHNRDCF